jgi:hypothetical protein
MLRRLALPLAIAFGLTGTALGATALLADDEATAPRRAVVTADSGDDPVPDKWVDVHCPDGFTVVGGGGHVPHGNDTPGVAIYWSAPYGSGWQVAAQDTARRDRPWDLQVTAICLEGVRDAPTAAGSLPPQTFSPAG